jgi:MFS superfamily sulfate permease-like transporter
MAAAVLGRLPGTTVYRNVKQYPDSYIYHGMIILRIDSPIYFGNINFIKERYSTTLFDCFCVIIFLNPA